MSTPKLSAEAHDLQLQLVEFENLIAQLQSDLSSTHREKDLAEKNILQLQDRINQLNIENEELAGKTVSDPNDLSNMRSKIIRQEMEIAMLRMATKGRGKVNKLIGESALSEKCSETSEKLRQCRVRLFSAEARSLVKSTQVSKLQESEQCLTEELKNVKSESNAKIRDLTSELQLLKKQVDPS